MAYYYESELRELRERIYNLRHTVAGAATEAVSIHSYAQGRTDRSNDLTHRLVIVSQKLREAEREMVHVWNALVKIGNEEDEREGRRRMRE